MINRPIELRKKEKRKNFGRNALLAILILRSRIKGKDRIKKLDREVGLKNRVKKLNRKNRAKKINKKVYRIIKLIR
jgi:hypothetical protein